MTANISKDAKTASIHLPVGRSVMAGVLSYLGIEHKDENDLPCYFRFKRSEDMEAYGLYIIISTGAAQRAARSFLEGSFLNYLSIFAGSALHFLARRDILKISIGLGGKI